MCGLVLNSTKNLNDGEMNLQENLLSILNSVYLPLKGVDPHLWCMDSKSIFPIRSLY